MAKSLMVQGTASYSGKTFLVMTLCKIFVDKGYKVAPFKSQNTSLNSFVTKDGKEIARAQALQALAAGVDPVVEMNPILIKPTGEGKAQIVVNGEAYKDIEARNYYEDFALNEGIEIIKEAFNCLKKDYELIIIEGAGSPAEINLYHCDIANMRTADITNSQVILIADIDRGGVFASVYGTIKLLNQRHEKRVKGIVINKFRGDMEILRPGIEMIEKLVDKPVLGVIPHIHDLKLPSEDSVSLGFKPKIMDENGADIAVIKLPRISNFTDFEPLIDDGAEVRFIDDPIDMDSPSAIIIPGTKNTIEDLIWLRNKGFEEKISGYYGKIPIIGICGGYQILGKKIINEIDENLEKEIEGLDLLNVETKFKEYKKTTRQVKGRVIASKGIFREIAGEEVSGYEIHMGETVLGQGVKPLFDLGEKYDGAISGNGMVFGTYLHGIFDDKNFRERFLKGLEISIPSSGDAKKIWMKNIEKAAAVVTENIDIKGIEGWLNE